MGSEIFNIKDIIEFLIIIKILDLLFVFNKKRQYEEKQSMKVLLLSLFLL